MGVRRLPSGRAAHLVVRERTTEPFMVRHAMTVPRMMRSG